MGAMMLAFRRTRDPFHPLIFCVPMFLVLYVFLPLGLNSDGALSNYFSDDWLQFVQLVNLLGTASFCLGCLVGTGKKKIGARPRMPDITYKTRGIVTWFAYILGAIGFTTYVIGVYNMGGFSEAYGQAYGGGWWDYGYAREAVMWCALAIILILTVNAQQSRSNFSWWIHRGLCFLFALPFIFHGILGARRGPIFQIVAVIGLSWYIMRQKRPRLLTMVSAGLVLSALLLFLVSNRTSIYLGSDAQFNNNPLEYFKANDGRIVSGNEYIYGAGCIVNATVTDNYYWGLRYFAIIFIRPIPRQLWPNKYEDVGVKGIETNLGLGDESFYQTLGWAGALGAAPGLIADMWVEFYWFLLPVLYLIGWIYGRTWRAACTGSALSTVLYILMASLTLFLVFQTLEAMLFRFLFMAIPAYLILKRVESENSALSVHVPSGVRYVTSTR